MSDLYQIKLHSLNLKTNTANATSNKNKTKGEEEKASQIDIDISNAKGILALDSSFIGIPMSIALKIISFFNKNNAKKNNAKCSLVEGPATFIRCKNLNFPKHFRHIEVFIEVGDEKEKFPVNIESSTLYRDCKQINELRFDCFLNFNVLSNENEENYFKGLTGDKNTST